MDSYKIKAVTDAIVEVEFTIKGKVSSERFDSRYPPVTDAEALAEHFNQYTLTIAADTPSEIPSAVKAMVGVKQTVEEINEPA